jgi:hypothetical protein
MRRWGAALVAALLATATVGTVGAVDDRRSPSAPTPGDPGLGDPYFPLAGNGGYDVDSYHLDLRYDPASDVLSGIATIRARSTQALSAFNFDLVGLTVLAIEVDGGAATFTRSASELTVTPSRSIADHSSFEVVVRYEGAPRAGGGGGGGLFGFIPTDDGVLVAGQPESAAYWYPVNDHPRDAAAYRFDITVPDGLVAVANGVLTDQETRDGWTTWSWVAKEPMAPYLTTASVGEFEVNAYEADGIRYWDAIDPDLLVPLTPHSGARALVSGAADSSYKRLTRTITVPATGATLTFWLSRSTEAAWDYFFVEARTPGAEDWTTLPEASGRTSTDTGASCPSWFDVHPSLAHYQQAGGGLSCRPQGTTGEWHATSGHDPEWALWTIDLGDYAGAGAVEVSLAYVSDDTYQLQGVVVDDIVVSTGEGSTSFEDDDDPLDGWVVGGPPASSPRNGNDWTVGSQADLPAPLGRVATEVFARQPEIIEFLAGYFGPYPFGSAGAIVDDVEGLGFALENQTRPIYSFAFFFDRADGESVVVHELAHQWFGDDLRLGLWQDIWLNEGFATYAEWLWSEREGGRTAQATFDRYLSGIPAADPFWTVTIGDPGPDRMFDGAVYVRGAMTLHALRVAVGDDAFFQIVRAWAAEQSGDTVSTAELILLAEQISGRDLDALFDAWLFTPTRPEPS